MLGAFDPTYREVIDRLVGGNLSQATQGHSYAILAWARFVKAAHIVRPGSPEDALEIVDIPVPEPGPEAVQIRVEACALNHLDVFAIHHRRDLPTARVVTLGLSRQRT